MGIMIVVQPKPKTESFAQLVYDKFLTLNMTQYKRVMFLDADMIPMTNLDYYFYLSDPEYEELPTELKPNFIIATRREPCNTGMFMVEPSKIAFEQYQNIVKRQHEKAKTLPYPYFDYAEGWGHNFLEHGDYWESVQQKSFHWKFHASHSDQGLMYYFAKYIRQNVSIAIGERIQNWRTGNDSLVPELESEKTGVLAMHQGEILRYQWSCDKPKEDARVSDVELFWWKCTPPYDSTAHFMGDKKPWRRKYVASGYTTYSFRQTGARYLWFKELTEVNEKYYSMGLDMDRWNENYLPWMQDELLGKMALFSNQKDVVMSTAIVLLE
jgi:Alpha-N-acetylglucosamine transferase